MGGGDRFAGSAWSKTARKTDETKKGERQMEVLYVLPSVHLAQIADTRVSDTGGTRAHSHKAIWPQRRCLRRCWAASQSTCRICPSYKHFPPISCFVHRVHAKSPVLSEGTLQCSSFFGVHNRTLSLEQVLRPPDNISSCYTLRLKLPALGGTHRGR